MERAEPALAARIRAGERRAIAQALTLVENDGPGAGEVLEALAPHLGRAHVVGITGAPGAGKSTLVNALLGALVAQRHKVAVVAVDPSSPITGGAVLGDRVRMGEHGAHPDVFIRSVSSRGHLGGLSRATRQMVDVLDAAGFDTVIVETVGAGQSEVAITGLADTRVVVCPPGLGDDVQAIKAGILEIADVLVVNKADLPAADTAMRELRDMLRLRAGKGAGIALLRTAATRGEGIAELVAALAAHRDAHGVGQRLHVRPRATATSAAPHAGTQRNSDATARVMQLAGRPDFARTLGVRCVEGGAGQAVVQMTVGEEHLSFNGACHGGMLFTLADTAFGLASNSHGALAVGIDTHMTFHVAAMPGDLLTATAVEVSRSRRLAVYRVDVVRGDGALLGAFTGTVYLPSRANPEGAPGP